MITLKIGIVGGGIIGEAHINAFKSIEKTEVIAFVDPKEEVRTRLARIYSIRQITGDYKELLKDDSIDIIYICTPNYLHHRIAIDSLNAGKNVICEKPLARTLQEADEMIDAAKKMNKRFFIALNHRFDPANQKVKELLNNGIIGSPFLVSSTFIGDEYGRMNNPLNWKGSQNESGGGVLIDNGIHIIDILRYFFGEVRAVTAVCVRLLIEPQNKAEDTALVALEFENNMLAELSVTFSVRYCPWLEGYQGAAIRTDIYGVRGAIQLTGNCKTIISLTKEGRIPKEEFIQDNLATNLLVNEDRHFIDCILSGKEPIVTAEDGKESLKIVLAAYKSSKEKRKVLLEEFE